MLNKFGINEEDLPEQFSTKTTEGRILIVDGDAACYRAAAKAAKLQTAISRFQTEIYQLQFLTKAEEVRVHITPAGCFKRGRHLLKTYQPYQGNRKNKEKPALLEPLRLCVHEHFYDHDNVVVIPNWDWEADDGIMIDQYKYSDKDVLVISEDKDLDIGPAARYNPESGDIHRIDNRYGSIWLKETPAGAKKIRGHGTKFFWSQMLTGDSADHIKGLVKYNGKLCGPVAAFNALELVNDESWAANLVLNGYRQIKQNPLPEGEALWLIRHPEDSFCKYLMELDLTPTNKDFVESNYGDVYHDVLQ